MAERGKKNTIFRSKIRQRIGEIRPRTENMHKKCDRELRFAHIGPDRVHMCENLKNYSKICQIYSKDDLP